MDYVTLARDTLVVSTAYTTVGGKNTGSIGPLPTMRTRIVYRTAIAAYLILTIADLTHFV